MTGNLLGASLSGLIGDFLGWRGVLAVLGLLAVVVSVAVAIGFRGGGLITAVIGIAMMPWRLLETSGNYIFVWLGGYSALLGAVGGILICDYWVLRRQRLNLKALYDEHGRYSYGSGVNWRAIIALVIAVLTCAPGFLDVATNGRIMIAQPLHVLYPYAWFVTFGLAFVLYYLLMLGQPAGRED